MNCKPLLFFFLWIGSLYLGGTGHAQSLTQSIRGTVYDADTREPLIGAEVFVADVEPLIGTVTDVEGNYELVNVPVGPVRVQSSYAGYAPYVRDNIQLTSARAYQLDIELQSGLDLAEVVVQAYDRNAAVNDAAVASIRRLDPEALQYHAATANDPGRLVVGFPGVQPSRDSRSDVVIRGNSSAGILWRLEGIDIPNPNHFARRGSSGGGITIFSASLLGSSDFSTGAFPAEYGNAFAGVFDMKFRHGDLYERQYTFRAGLLGLDVATEGPIAEGKSSYLANFRYSTLGILNSMGLYLVGPRTDNNFQDLSFKIYQKGERSQLSFWGIGGNSRENFNAADRPWQTYSDYETYEFTTRMAALGLSWNYLLDDRSYVQVNFGASGQDIYVRTDTLAVENERPAAIEEEDLLTRQLILHAFYKRTISPRFNFKLGNLSTLTNFDLRHQMFVPEDRTLLDAEGNAWRQQWYARGSWRPLARLEVHLGAHVLGSLLPDASDWQINPRIALDFRWTDRTQLALAYGGHGQVLPLGTYFYQESGGQQPNLDLGLLQAQHLVLAWDQQLTPRLTLHTEAYWQQLRRVPVGLDVHRIYWLLNDVDGFGEEPLRPDGTGRNLGVDVRLEQYFNRGTFFVWSGSVFRSTFRVPGSNKRYPTQYDGRYSMTFTGGKSWQLSDRLTLESGLRVLFNGGNPITPLRAGFENLDGPEPLLDTTDPFGDRVAFYLRPDLRIALRKNLPKSSWWLALDIQNFINRRNEDFIDYEFQAEQNRWGHRLQSGLTPLLTFQMDL